MAKTLKITTITAAALAVVFLTLSVAFGLRDDPEIERFLNLPGIIEVYKADSAAETEKADQTSPLMKQAESFALRINPPRPKSPIVKPVKPPTPRPTKVSAKFTLLGTVVYVVDPVRSLALIDEPGKGLHWVRQSDNIGHLKIEQINDGHILVRDGDQISPLYAEHPEKKSLLKSTPVISQKKESKPAGPQIRSQPPRPRHMPQSSMSTRRINLPDQKDTPKNHPESMGISPEEAEDLGQMGTILKAMEEELLRIEKESQDSETAPAPNEPNRQ